MHIVEVVLKKLMRKAPMYEYFNYENIHNRHALYILQRQFLDAMLDFANECLDNTQEETARFVADLKSQIHSNEYALESIINYMEKMDNA
jgi:hypothetical protein